MFHVVVVYASALVLLACGGTQKPAPVAIDDIARANAPAIVQVIAGDRHGTGIVVESDGLIATTLQLLQGRTQIRVLLSDQSAHPVVEVEAYDPVRELALVRIRPPRSLPTVQLGDLDALSAGDMVYELDHASTAQGTVAEVRVLSPDLTVLVISANNVRDWIGPVFDVRGDVVGLSAAYVGSDKVIAVPTSYLGAMIADQRSISVEDFAAETSGNQ